MSADQWVGAVLIAGGVVVVVVWLALALARAAGRKRPTPPPTVPRTFFYCTQRGCTARATRIVMMIGAPMESRVVCDSDRDQLTLKGWAIDLGPVYRGRA